MLTYLIAGMLLCCLLLRDSLAYETVLNGLSESAVERAMGRSRRAHAVINHLSASSANGKEDKKAGQDSLWGVCINAAA